VSERRNMRAPLKYAATTVTQSRVSIFAPSRRPSGVRTVVVENAWGRAEVTADLTQIHRDIIDLLVGSDEFVRRQNPDGSLDVAFAPHALLRMLGHSHPGKDHIKWLRSMFEDLRLARFTCTLKRGEVSVTGTSGIVSEYDDAKDRDGNYLGQGVRLSRRFMAFWSADQPCHTERLTTQITVISSGAVQAVVRFCLTHSDGYIGKIDDVLQIIGVTGVDRVKRARADLRTYQGRLREDFSVVLDWSAGMLRYTRRPEVWFGNRRSVAAPVAAKTA